MMAKLGLFLTHEELIDISHALLCYRTDSTIIDPKGNGLTDEQKSKYTRLTKLMDKVSESNQFASKHLS